MEILKWFLAISLMFSVPTTAVWAKKGPNLRNSCKAACPNVKGHHELEKCIEDKLSGPDADAFKGSDCYKAYEAHEANHHGEHAEHEEHHDEPAPADKK